MISIIVCCDENGVFAVNGKSVIPPKGDLKRFKELTDGYPIIMGSLTWESLPKQKLPGRCCLIISKERGGYRTLAQAIDACKEIADNTLIIGGQRSFSEGLDIADRVYLTRIPELDIQEGDDIRVFDVDFYTRENWRLIQEENFDDHDFLVYERVK